MPNHGEAIPNIAKGSDSVEIARKLQFGVIRRLYSRFVLMMTISCWLSDILILNSWVNPKQSGFYAKLRNPTTVRF